jgi:tetratricopeptide (TPR) repeat protein
LNPEALPAYFAKSAAYARLDRYRSAARVLEIASAKQPKAFLPWALMGDLAARRGDSAQARRDYARASRLNPYDKELARLARSRVPGNTDGD